jgi:hypothetical protein
MLAWKRFGRQEGDIAAIWHNVLIHIQTGAATPASIPNLAAGAKSILLRHRTFAFILVIEPQAPPPAHSIRKQLTDFLNEYQPKIIRAIVVPEGGGFRAATVRGVGTAVSLLAPKAFNFSFCETIGDAAMKIGPVIEPLGGAAALSQVIEQIRADRTVP